MRLITFKDVIYKGKPLCDCLIQKDMDLEQAMEVYCKAYNDLRRATSLDQVRMAELGIKNTCELTYENLLTEIINSLLDADKDIRNSMGLINKAVNQIISNKDVSNDEKVKASNKDAQAGYLADKVKSNQPGTIAYTDNEVVFTGFVPVGACFFISRSRIGDFDASGKGKQGTDLWGYAISNGENNTTNRLGGGHPKYVQATDLNSAGNRAGSANFTVKKENLESFSMPVTGSISDALTTPVSPKLRYNTNKMKDGAGGSTHLLRLGSGKDGSNDMEGLSLNLQHSHNFSLKADYTNSAPTPIPLVPEHMLEIPIERINP